MTMGMADNDASASYWQHRQEATAEDIIARARARIRPKEAIEPKADDKQTGPVKIPLGDYVTTGITVDGVKRAAKDVVQGVVEAPRQAVGGVSDAVHNSMMGLSRLGDWINENVVDARIPVPLTGIEELDKIIADPFKAVAGNKNEVAEAESTTGGVVREASRFLTGFLPLFKAGKAAGMGSVTAGAVAGGVTDAATRDPQEENLVNMLKAYPALQNPVVEFLQSDPDDPEALARVKKGLEGAGLGVMTDGVILGVKAIAKARRSGVPLQKAADTLAEQKAQYGELKDDAFGPLGDPKAAMVRKIDKAAKATETGVPDDIAAKGLVKAGESEGQDVYINFARINEPDDVKKVMKDMANAFKGDIDEARRGVQSNEATQELADQLGMSVGDLLSRRKGQGFNAEQAVAARKIWHASTEKLTELAKKAADPNAGAVDQFNFRRMMALHYAIQAEVIGARTETARALQSWRIPVGGGVEKAKQIQNLIDTSGGPSFSKEMAQRIAMLADQNPDAVNQFVAKTWGAATKDALQEAWINGLLSGPKTHLVNVMSNTLVAFQQIMERGVAEKIAGMRGGEVVNGESVAMAYGMISSLKDAFRLAGKAFRTGDQQAVLGKVDLPNREPAIHGDWLRETGHSGLASAVDFIGHTARVPTRLLGAEDAFFKTIGYRMELHAQALRQANAEGLRGPEAARRMAEIVNNPPESIRLAAADAALYSTFANQTGKIGQAVIGFRDKVPGAFFILPFVKTPVNIARYAFERSPAAPLVGQWRDDLAAGGARRDLALARMSTGSAIMLVGADLADRGLITGAGPDDQGEKENWLRQGKKPFSVKVGNNWISYDRMDPLGMTLGFAASIAELSRRYDIEPEEMDEVNEVVASAVTAVANTVVNKTYMRGISSFFEAITEGKTNPEAVQGWMRQFSGSFVPSVAGTVEQIVDPVQREQMKLFDAAQAKIAGLSNKLTPKRDLWGEPIKSDSPVYDALSPVQISPEKESAIDKEMTRLNTNIQRISKRVNWDGVDVNLRDWPEVYDAYTELAGNKLKHPAWGLGAKDFLDKVVTGEHEMSAIYDMLPSTRRAMDGGKAAYIAKTISDYRALARRAIIDDPKFADFARSIDQGKADKREKKMPGLGAELRP